jgi:hypothetical protein
MTQPTSTHKQTKADQRRARLAAELRANLRKRKQQMRGRGSAHQAIQDAGRDREEQR